MKRIREVVLLVCLGLVAQLTTAAPPQTINYQGYLTNPGGTPISAVVNMTFSLFSVQSGGAALWSESQSLTVTNGQFNAALGTGTLLSGAALGALPFNAPYFLEVTAGGEILSPRVAMSSTAYAFRATSLEPGSALSGSQLDLTGNIILAASAPGIGNITKAGTRFIHNFGTENTFVGVSSGNFTMTGTDNAAVGFRALISNTTGGSNTAAGALTLVSNTTGMANTAVGTFALESNTTGAQNTAVGVDALNRNVSGNSNTATGLQALFSNFGGNENTANGSSALKSNTFGSKNTATGALALQNNTTGNTNTANGWNSLGSNTTGFRNTAIGESALFANTSGTDNTASGLSALAVNRTGGFNTANGATALLLNTVGNNNTADGALSLNFSVLGNDNTAVGKGALYIAGRTDTAGAFTIGASYTILSTGTTDFTLIGAADSNVGTVFVATGVGIGTGTAASNAHNNTALGANAGSNLTTGSNNIAIGNGGVATVSNTTWIGQAQNRAFIAGVRGITTGFNNAIPVMIDGAGQLGTVSSSRRFKDNIADMDTTSSGLMGLRPVTFHYKSDQSPDGRALQYGLIAEEVANHFPGLVAHSADGQIETVMYQFLPTMLLNEFQKQQRTIETQVSDLRHQSEELAQQRNQLETLKSELAAIKSLLVGK